MILVATIQPLYRNDSRTFVLSDYLLFSNCAGDEREQLKFRAVIFIDFFEMYRHRAKCDEHRIEANINLSFIYMRWAPGSPPVRRQYFTRAN